MTKSFLRLIIGLNVLFPMAHSWAQVIPNCESIVQTGILYQGIAASAVTATVPYTNGQGQAYPAAFYNSYGISGLTAYIDAGFFDADEGFIQFNIEGTPNAIGTAFFNVFVGDSICIVSLNVSPPPTLAFVSALLCNQTTVNGTLTNGTPASNSSFTIPYNGGNGGLFGLYTVASTGVSGLTATINQGSVQNGSGTITFLISGTPNSAGTAFFNVIFGTQNCLISMTVNSPPAAITSLDCGNRIDNGVLIVNSPAAGVSTLIPYTGGNQGSFSAFSTTSTGVTGLTATISSGVLANGPGNLSVNITGTPSAPGLASFTVNFAGQSCSFIRNVNSPSGNLGTLDCASADSIIASWDFNTGIPEEWTQQVTSDNGIAQWEYRGPNTSPGIYVGARGNCAAIAQPINSFTQNNGFVLFDANYWDAVAGNCGNFSTGLDPVPAQGYHAELTTNPILINNESSLLLSFNQQYRLLGPNSFFNFQTSINVLISTDGVNWNTVYTQSGNTQSANVLNSAVNISSYITGADSLQIKFLFAGSYFWWIIDDVCLYRPSANDISISETSFLPTPSVFTSPNHISEYTQYPLSMPPLLRYKAKATNNGFNSQNNIKLRGIVKRDNVQVSNTLSSLSINLGSLQNGQIQFSNNYSPPNSSAAQFEVIYKLEQTEIDDVPANNSDTTTFLMTNNILAKDRGSAEEPFPQGAENISTLRSDGNYFTISNVGNYCHGLKVGFDETTAPNTMVQAKIVQLFYNSDDESVSFGNIIASTNPVAVNAAHINFPGEEDLATLLFSTPVALTNGATYFVYVQETQPQSEFGVARSGVSRNYTSTSSYENYFLEILPYDTIETEVDTSFIVYDTLLINDTIQIVETLIDTSFLLETILYDTTTVVQLDERISDKSFMIRMLMGYSTAQFGCTDITAVNYNASAVNNDNSCYYLPGCTLPNADNYNPEADYDNGTCQIAGCTDPEAENYLSYATIPDTCIYPPEGCTEPLAVNYDPLAVVDDGSCLILGCTDVNAANYIEEANSDDSSCLYRGCLDSIACNFDINFDLNGDCLYPGCINPDACNYNESAACDDGSCCFGSCNQLQISQIETTPIEWGMLLNGTEIINGSGPANSFVCNPSACDYQITLSGEVASEILVELIDQTGLNLLTAIVSFSTQDTVLQFGLGEVVFGCNDPMAINFNASATCNDGTCLTYGCTNVTGVNYLPNATIEDGSCYYAGCTDVLASNYSDTVMVDNGSCLYPGCNDSLALNFDEEYNFNDGSCIYPIPGCTNPLAINFNPLAQVDNDSCVIIGCTNSLAINYNPEANTDNGNCIIFGCTDSTASNFLAAANQNDGGCIYNSGCTDSTALNFEPGAITDNGSCLIPGCTNSSASNYNSLANIDDGSCQFLPSGCTDTSAFNFDPEAIIDDGSCDYQGCAAPDACNFNPLAAANANNCIYPGDPCNDQSQLTSFDVIGEDCVCAGQESSMFGCTNVLALNYNPNAETDDGSCFLQAPELLPNNTIGCSPQNTFVAPSSVIAEGFDCLWMMNDAIIDSTCSTLLLQNLGPGEYEITLQVGLVNPWLGIENSSSSSTTIYVIEGALQPEVDINHDNQTLTCTNCENQIQWFYNGEIAGISQTISYFNDSLVSNGVYDLVFTSSNGCISDTTSIIVAAAFLASNLTVGCSPLHLELNSPILLLDGMSCSLSLNGEIIQQNFSGTAELDLNIAGENIIEQTCTYLDSLSQSSIVVMVNESFSPELVNNLETGLVECSNSDVFDSLAWTIDGAFAGNESAYPNTGIIYSCAGFGPNDCMNQSTINISVSEVESDVSNMESLVIYPNPSSGFIQIQSHETVLSISAYNSLGKMIANAKNQNSLDLSAFDQGVYVIRIETADGASFQKLELMPLK